MLTIVCNSEHSDSNTSGEIVCNIEHSDSNTRDFYKTEEGFRAHRFSSVCYMKHSDLNISGDIFAKLKKALGLTALAQLKKNRFVTKCATKQGATN